MKLKDIKAKLYSHSPKYLIDLFILFLVLIAFLYFPTLVSRNTILGDILIQKTVFKQLNISSSQDFDESDLKKLTNLNLRIHSSDNISFESLNKFTELEVLSIISDRDIDLSDINLPKLKYLSIINSSDNLIDWVLPKSQSLEDLYLSSYQKIDLEFIKSLNSYENLKILTINHLSSLYKSLSYHYDDCSFLSKYPCIEDLSFICSNFKSLDGIENMKNLNNISFTLVQIDDISALLKLNNIDTISMINVSISDENIQTLRNHFGDKISIEIDNE